MDNVVLLPARKRGVPAKSETEAAVVPLRSLCPNDEHFTEYDSRNLTTYACLLDGEGQGASLDEMAVVVFQVDPEKNRDWARRLVLSHLRRAHWVNDHMFPCFDWGNWCKPD